jgi:hypothetical protein
MLVAWRQAAATVPLARASTWILGIAYRTAMSLVGRNSLTAVGENTSRAHNIEAGAAIGALSAGVTCQDNATGSRRTTLFTTAVPARLAALATPHQAAVR